jgi:RluA family pseudouridine synthase
MAENLARRHSAIAAASSPLPGSRPYDHFKPVNVPAEADGQTVTAALCCVVKHLPATHWEAECGRGLILTAQYEAVPATKIVRAGERYLHKFPGVTEPDVNASIEILHEDEALIVVNKPAPLPMHAGGRFNFNTLQYFLNQAYHPQKPCPAHRLDANTTGLVLVTRTRHFAGQLQPQFARGSVEKTYLVRVQGQPREAAFDCRAPISTGAGQLGSRSVDPDNGLSAHTEFRVLKNFPDNTTLLEARPMTGRTNQIRIHLWHLDLPVRGDQVYLAGSKIGNTQTLSVTDPPLCLHAWKIKFVHPLIRQPAEFAAPAPSWAAV